MDEAKEDKLSDEMIQDIADHAIRYVYSDLRENKYDVTQGLVNAQSTIDRARGTETATGVDGTVERLTLFYSLLARLFMDAKEQFGQFVYFDESVLDLKHECERFAHSSAELINIVNALRGGYADKAVLKPAIEEKLKTEKMGFEKLLKRMNDG